VVASSLYVVNWRFAAQATDYLAQDAAASIVQHYWTLSVEEQFYLVWPLLLLVVTWLPRRFGWTARGLEWWCGIAFAVVFVPSLVWSVYLSEADPARAYFVTTTRMWELALGGLLAIFLPRLARVPRLLAAVCGWAGMAAVVWAGLSFSGSTAFPGVAALLPTVGAAGIIASGVVSGRYGPTAVLDTRPMRAIGALSYSLYLWHWVVLVGAEAGFGPLHPVGSLAAVLFSALPAWLTYRYVENPIRYAERFRVAPVRGLRLGLAVTLVPVLAALAFHHALVRPAAEALADESTVDVGPLIPDPVIVRDDLPSGYDEGCHQREGESAATACVYGADDGYTIAVVGDSHAAQWVPAFEVAARTHGWHVVAYTKSGCPLISADVAVGPKHQSYRDCTVWNKNVLAKLVGGRKPDLVVTTNTEYRLLRDGDLLGGDAWRAAFIEGLRERWRILTAAGIPVVVVRDTPRPGFDVADCVAANLNRLNRCTFPRARALDGIGPVQVDAARGQAGVHVVDLNDVICPADPCAPVIGRVIVYRDSHHLTRTYADSLGPRLYAALTAAVPRGRAPRPPDVDGP
jgi:peptidoglycan/LPS O-acetylase OafA/YrhL